MQKSGWHTPPAFFGSSTSIQRSLAQQLLVTRREAVASAFSQRLLRYQNNQSLSTKLKNYFYINRFT